MLSSHPSAGLEYWFFKVNAGPTALLVDWIERRRPGDRILRVSIHAPQKRAVLFGTFDTAVPGPQSIDLHHTAGQIEDVAWNLSIEPGPRWIAPDIFPARLLRLPDLSLSSAPLATFTGTITVAGQPVELDHAPGMVSQYWGRQLAAEWWWVSASAFDKPGVAVECALIRSSIWGIPARLPLAYLYMREGDRGQLIMPLPGMAEASGTPENFEIRVSRIGKPDIWLIATGRNYGDLGDGIINTLVGDLEIREGERVIGRAEGSVGLERRAPDRRG